MNLIAFLSANILYRLTAGRLTILLTMVGIAVATANLFASHILPGIKAYRDRRSIKKSINAPFLTNQEIEESCRFYIEPFVQSVDPMGSEEPRALVGVKSKLFDTLDQLLSISDYRYIILLADSGMGKTSASINYTVRSVRRRRQPHEIVLIQLQKSDVVDKIKNVNNKRNTVLFLDAFDEDTLAIRDHRGRISELMRAAEGFKRVVVTSRTQFFGRDEEIPREVATLKVASRSAGESAKYNFHKLYLSPFTQQQCKDYLRKRYPFEIYNPFNRAKRRLAVQLANKIPNLATRPLLLSHIEILVKNPLIRYSFEAYEEMVQAWLERENGFVEEEDQLERFSKLLAVELFMTREMRRGERIPRPELVRLATDWGIPVKDRELSDYRISTRSLLNRDAEGNYKFAHRSIMEYLFVKQYAEVSLEEAEVMRSLEWTDQMLTFYWEMLEKAIVNNRRLPFNERDINGDYVVDLEHIPFLINTALHGLSQLRSPKIAEERLYPILETVTAICARLIDPLGADDPVVTLIQVLRDKSGRPILNPVAIHHNGGLLDVSTADIAQHVPTVEHAFFGGYVPDIYDEEYENVLDSFVRLTSYWHSISMPVRYRGTLVALFVGETSRPFAFGKNWQRNIIGILVSLGRYLYEIHH